MSDVEFLASAWMGVLIAAQDELAPAVGFAVVADGPATSRPLKLVGVTDVVDLYATLDEALGALTS
jgi:anti-anti-sigma regulatory factor